MVRINKKSIFGNVDLDDPDAIRRLIVALHYTLKNRVWALYAPELKAVQGRPEDSVVNMIRYRIRYNGDYTLLLKASLDFIEARDGTDDEILEAAKKFETLTPDLVLTPMYLFVKEYVAIDYGYDMAKGYCETLESLEEQAPGCFGKQCSTRHTGEKLEALKRAMEPKPRGEPPYTYNEQACLLCVGKKDRCNKEEPTCRECRLLKLMCVYPAKPDHSLHPLIETDGMDGNQADTDEDQTDSDDDTDSEASSGDEGEEPSDEEEDFDSDELTEETHGKYAKLGGGRMRKRDSNEENFSLNKRNRMRGIRKMYEDSLTDSGKRTPREGKHTILRRRSAGLGGIGGPSSKLNSQDQSDSSDLSSLRSEDLEEPEIENKQKKTLHKFTPLRLYGEKVIDDVTKHDRAPLKTGRAQPKKLIIEYNVEREDPKHPGKAIKTKVKHQYPNVVDWKDKKSVGLLTKWRRQIFSRAFGIKKERRLVWLIVERDALLDILEKHLATIGGQWSKIDWEHVADEFNQRFKGKVQNAGEMTAVRRYDKSDRKGKFSKSEPLKNWRKGPNRSGSAIRYQMSYFEHPRVKKLMEKAQAADKKARYKSSSKVRKDLVDEDEENDLENEEEDVGDCIEVDDSAMTGV